MPVLRTGSFKLYGHSVSARGGWVDGALLTPPDSGNDHATNIGSVVTTPPATLTKFGATLLDTTTEGTGLPATSPPNGFQLRAGAYFPAGFVTVHTGIGGSGGGVFSTGLGGYTNSGFGDWVIMDSLVTYGDITSLFTATVTSFAGLNDWSTEHAASSPTAGQTFIEGGYDILAYWWIKPDKDACGNQQDSQLQLSATQPDSSYQLLDPANPLTAQPTVKINTIEPAEGPTAGGTSVTIKGSGFGIGATVTFDGVSATSVVVVSQYEVTCDSPAHAIGTGDVVVTNLDGTHN